MQKYRKTALIEAIQLSTAPGKHGPQCKEFVDIELEFGNKVSALGNNVNGDFECIGFNIKTLEGIMTAAPGDWIARGVKGEIWPIKPDIFAATYEPAE